MALVQRWSGELSFFSGQPPARKTWRSTPLGPCFHYSVRMCTIRAFFTKADARDAIQHTEL